MIARDPREAAARRWDLIVVGGGIYGAILLLEAARRGLSGLLVERDDFGGATSWNSLRIVHGGLRYLQTLDLPRFRESVAERRSWLLAFPDLVEPLTCLMPLYGRGLRRPAVLRLALAANDLLSARRNRGVRADRRIARGRLLSAAETAALFPAVGRAGLAGGALWHDAAMPDSQRLLVEVLRWAASRGAAALNYTAAEGLLVERGRAAGVTAHDRLTGSSIELHAPVVVNCAGPWCREVARRLDRDVPALFSPALAFNLFLDREPPSPAAVAVSPPRPGAGTYFLVPWKGGTLVGTCHLPAGDRGDRGDPSVASDRGPSAAEVRLLLDDLDAAVPGFGARQEEVLRVHWGLLPARRPGGALPGSRPVIHDHGRGGGPEGLWSVSGVKLTTARRVAEETLRRIAARRSRPLPPASDDPRPSPAPPLPLPEIARLFASDPEAAAGYVARLAAAESVVEPDDLLLRRTDWGVHPVRGAAVAREVRRLLGRRVSPAVAAGAAP